MSETKHTPGPWKAESKKGPHNVEGTVSSLGIFSVAKAQILIEEYDGDEEEAVENSWVCGIWGPIDAEDEANAHLIAAAPDLLEACRCALGHLTGNMDGDMDIGDPVEMLRAAIRKAEGSLT